MPWVNIKPQPASPRMKVLLLSAEEALRVGLNDVLLNLDSGGLMDGANETAILAIIRRARPGLHSCVLEALDFDVDSREFKFVVSDPSFPRKAPSCYAEREPLLFRDSP